MATITALAASIAAFAIHGFMAKDRLSNRLASGWRCYVDDDRIPSCHRAFAVRARIVVTAARPQTRRARQRLPAIAP